MRVSQRKAPTEQSRRAGGKKPRFMKHAKKLKTLKSRGASTPERSESGGAVKGRIPKSGGSNAMDWKEGMGHTKEVKYK